MSRNLGNAGRNYDVRATTSSGFALKTGDEITGGYVVRDGGRVASATSYDLVVDNGIVKVTTEQAGLVDQYGACHLYRDSSNEYVRALTQDYGDWTFFVVPFVQPCDRIKILEATETVVEFAMTWDSMNLNVAYLSLGGVVDRDWVGQAQYDSGGALKMIRSVEFTKVVRVERDREGYFVGYHSDPWIGPKNGLDGNNENSQQEREFGTGSGNAVAFSSAGFSAHHPDWGNDATWAGAYLTQRHAWLRIDDPTYPPYDQAAYVTASNALDNSGAPSFPNEQMTGPWWVADLHNENTTTYPFCRYICLVNRLECGSWQFGVGATQYGATVIHFVNELRKDDNSFHRFQLFLGATPYVTTDMAAEPSAQLRGLIAGKAAALVWPD